jgi:acyl-CoA:acyl-CoA alkyltransferase
LPIQKQLAQGERIVSLSYNTLALLYTTNTDYYEHFLSLSMLFKRTAIAGIGYVLPEETWSSYYIEEQLAPVYERLKLPPGRLELMSGIAERRMWTKGTSITKPSIESCRRALAAGGILSSDIGCLIHASVCRDFLEPATACGVHAGIQGNSDAIVYDVSNACLGILNAAVQIATLIEAGVIRAGLAVGTENARGLLESTIEFLNSNTSLTRHTIKPAFASLTIGSGSAAWLLVDREYYQRRGSISAAVAKAHTHHNDLCQSTVDQTGSSMTPLMETDSELLLAKGIEAGADAYRSMTSETGYSSNDFTATVCHQVGIAHRRAMLDRLGLSPERDFATFSKLGNTGSVALPTALGIGLRKENLSEEDRKKCLLMGIGSGINSIMILGDFSDTQVIGDAIEI